jgi:hypothetical protein
MPNIINFKDIHVPLYEIIILSIQCLSILFNIEITHIRKIVN